MRDALGRLVDAYDVQQADERRLRPRGERATRWACVRCWRPNGRSAEDWPQRVHPERCEVCGGAVVEVTA